MSNVQCVPEQLKIKKAVIQELDSRASPDIIVASNSSSYTIADIIEELPLRMRERVVSLHSCALYSLYFVFNSMLCLTQETIQIGPRRQPVCHHPQVNSLRYYLTFEQSSK